MTACLQCCVAKYDSSVKVDAYDMQPTAKRPRRGRTTKRVASRVALIAWSAGFQAAQAHEPGEDRLIMIGAAMMRAITNVFTHCTEASYKLLDMRLGWVGD